MKDINDLLLANTHINSIPTMPIDIYCAQQILQQYPDDEQAQRKGIEKFAKTVKDPLVKADLAKTLAKQWDKELADVKEFLQIAAVDTVDEKLSKVSDIYDCFDALDKAIKDDEGGSAELSVGYSQIDANVTFRKKRVVLLGAFSNSGKTEMLIEWILHWVFRLKKNVLFFSLEMPKEDILEILIAKIIEIPQYEVRKYVKSDKGAEVYRRVAEYIESHLMIYDENDLDIDGMEETIALISRSKFDGKLDIVATDYYQYLQGIKTLDDDKITARKMKAIAKRHNVMFVMLSQFNKNSQRKGKDEIQHPTMVDLNGAGDIGASADVIVLLWRPIYYEKLSQMDEELRKYESRVFIPKARGGFKQGQQYYTFEYNYKISRLLEKSS